MMKDTPLKRKYNAEYIDSIMAYDREVNRISQSLRHNLDLGQVSLLGAQSIATGRPQMLGINRPGHYMRSPEADIANSIIGLEIHGNRIGQQNTILQLDGTYNERQ